jgi:hypothetical protein
MSLPLTPGKRLHNLLAGLRQQNAGTLSKEAWIAAATDFITLEIQTTKKIPRAKGVPAAAKPRNVLFDTLAECTGTRSLKEMSRAMLRTVGVALADIMAVTPDVTPDEIRRRARALNYAHPTWSLTATTLAKYWGDYSPTREQTRTGALDPYQEPPAAEWHAAAEVLYPGSEIPKRPWLDVPIDLRGSLIKQILRTRTTEIKT